MLGSWWAVGQLITDRGIIIDGVLADRQLVGRNKSKIASLYLALVVYLSLSFRVYWFCLAKYQWSFFSFPTRHVLIVVAFLTNIQFAASVILFMVACIHVCDK